jgi:hypothetical protein
MLGSEMELLLPVGLARYGSGTSCWVGAGYEYWAAERPGEG